MSIANIELITQQSQAGVITHAPNTLDFTNTIIVNRAQLTETYEETADISRRLHRIEDLTELDYSDLDYLCRTIHRAAQALGGMIEAKGEAR